MSDTSIRDLAEIGAQLDEETNELFKTTLRALASPSSGHVGTDRCIEFVAGQVYAEVEYSSPNTVQEYVETFLEVFDIDDIGDVDDLLGRERHVAQNYEGQLGMIRAG